MTGLPRKYCPKRTLCPVSSVKRVSSGKGRTTCGYYEYPKGDKIIYATTEGEPNGGGKCPPPPDQSKGYTWSIYPGYDIVEANPDGSNAHPIITGRGYDAEMTWCHKGGKAVFTEASVTEAYLVKANLARAKLLGVNLIKANLTGASLAQVNLTGANLIGANFTDANLTSANLTGANLTKANLASANLTETNLTGANLNGANLARRYHHAEVREHGRGHCPLEAGRRSWSRRTRVPK